MKRNENDDEKSIMVGWGKTEVCGKTCIVFECYATLQVCLF